MLKGNTDTAIDILNDRTAAFVSATDVVSKTTDEQKSIMLKQYETLTERAEQMEARYKAGVKGVTQEMVDEARAMAEKAGDEYEAVGGVIPERMAEGVELKKGTFTESTRDTVRAGIAVGRAEVNTQGIGTQLVDGMTDGLNNRKSTFRDAMKSIVRAGITAAKAEAQIKSPSRKMRDEVGHQIGKGAELGITDATAGIKSAIVGQMREVERAYSKSSKFKLDMSGVLGDVNSDLKKLSDVKSPIAFGRQSNVFNLYPRELTQAQIDYLIAKVNLALGTQI